MANTKKRVSAVASWLEARVLGQWVPSPTQPGILLQLTQVPSSLERAVLSGFHHPFQKSPHAVSQRTVLQTEVFPLEGNPEADGA